MAKREYLILIMTLLFFGNAYVDNSTWIIDPQSKLTVHGATNVNEFSCKIEHYAGGDTLAYVENTTTHELQSHRIYMHIPIVKFDCNPHPITADFKKTLKYETHPSIIINFVTFHKPSLLTSTHFAGIVEITLAGVTTQYTVDFTAKRDGNYILVTGNQPVAFSDYGLTPPKKLNGLITVQEVLHVEFNLVLKKVAG